MWGMITKGAGLLKDGKDAGDAIETAIREVEDFPYYKSVGYGGLPNEEMEVEMDAAFMDGDTLDIGAVAAIKDFANMKRSTACWWPRVLRNLPIRKDLSAKTC